MRIGKVVSVTVVSLASVIVIMAIVVGILFFASTRSNHQQNFAPHSVQQAKSPTGDTFIISQPDRDSSFLYRVESVTGRQVRLTPALAGIESEPSFSHDGKHVVYSYASSAESTSAIWMVDAGGRNAKALTSEREDASHPAFSPDDSEIYYAASNFTGHYSPVVRSARHDWDLFSRPASTGTATVELPKRITHDLLYDLRSLDVAADDLTPGGIRVLISTSGYPIGSLFREFHLGSEGKEKLFQPHVPGESSLGPSYGEARFIHNGTTILFLAATNMHGGDYDYNVYSMSDVTGGEIKQLTHLQGATSELKVFPDGKATFIHGTTTYELDIAHGSVKPLG